MDSKDWEYWHVSLLYFPMKSEIRRTQRILGCFSFVFSHEVGNEMDSKDCSIIAYRRLQQITQAFQEAANLARN